MGLLKLYSACTICPYLGYRREREVDEYIEGERERQTKGRESDRKSTRKEHRNGEERWLSLLPPGNMLDSRRKAHRWNNMSCHFIVVLLLVLSFV